MLFSCSVGCVHSELCIPQMIPIKFQICNEIKKRRDEQSFSKGGRGVFVDDIRKIFAC